MENELSDEFRNVSRTEILELNKGITAFLPSDENFQSGENPGTKEAFDCGGKDTKKLLILVRSTEHRFYDETGEDMLKKMMKALGFDLDECLVLNAEKCPVTKFAALKSYFGFEKLIAFGIHPKMLDLNVSIRKNEIGNMTDTSFLFTDKLEDLVSNPQLKRPLWGSLQQMFGMA